MYDTNSCLLYTSFEEIRYELAGVVAVSYTHLDVYKRQTQRSVLSEYIEEVGRLIDVLDTETEIKEWRSVYKNARTS